MLEMNYVTFFTQMSFKLHKLQSRQLRSDKSTS